VETAAVGDEIGRFLPRCAAMTRNSGTDTRLSLKLLGGLAIEHAGTGVDLPRSRKTRALLAFLALSPRPRRRSSLCTMFWERPDDPKGALRWSLSKIRPLVKAGDETLVITDGDFIDIDTRKIDVDVCDLLDTAKGADQWPTADLERLAAAGELLEGFTLAGCTDFELWLAEQREDVRRARLGAFDVLCHRHSCDPEKALGYARSAAEIEPTNAEIRMRLIDLLDQTGRADEADSHRKVTKDLMGTMPQTRTVTGTEASESTARPAATAFEGLPPAEPTLKLPDRPSVAVLPFQMIGPPSENEILAVGLTHDIIMGLSRLRWLFVIARGSAFNIVNTSADVLEIATKLGVRYITQGSIAVTGDKLRVDVALIDAPSRTEIWVERFDRNVSDLLLVQQEISDAIVGCLQLEIETAEQKRALARPAQELDAWSTYHRGVWHMNKFNAADFDRAEKLFERALELEPDVARVYAGLSFVQFQRAFLHIDRDYDGALRKSLDFAEKSVNVDPRDALGHWALGRTLLMFREYGQSIEELETAIELNPNFAGAHFSLSRTCFATGDSERGIDAADTARRLSPYDPIRFAMLSVRANCLVQLGKVDEAVDWVVRAARQPNAHYHIHAIATYCTALAGRDDLTSRYKEKLLAARPDYSLEDFLLAFPLKEPSHIELVREGFKKAGLNAQLV